MAASRRAKFRTAQLSPVDVHIDRGTPSASSIYKIWARTARSANTHLRGKLAAINLKDNQCQTKA